ncbi:MAG TPA: septation protein SepH [Actinomycetaceae bacterium]|nr:septation protein SepH [Actinomycetaceae bacterium]
MVELELVGLHSDGERITLAGPDGQRYLLLVDDALRAAVRRDRPQLEQIRAADVLRPRDIQARIRAGATAQEVADAAGLPIAHVQRYEGPVLAERGWVVEQARRFPVRHSEDSPHLGDLVLDRLATRGVRTADIAWDAVREEDAAWELRCRFTAGEKHRLARWEVDMAARSVHALDDEARWLSETEVAPSGPTARRHLSPVRLYDIEADADLGPALAAVDADLSAASAPDVGETPAIEQDDLGFGDLPAATTDDLLAELRASRGVRPDLPEGIDEEDLPPAAHPPASRPHEAFDAQVLPLPSSTPDEPAPPVEPADAGPARPSAAGDEPPTGGPASAPPAHRPSRRTARDAAASADEKAPSPKRRASRSRRASVPSWDEIVFGAKPD